MLQKAENSHGAWAWKCSILYKQSEGDGQLHGKSFALKDNIAVKDVSMLLGTNFIKDYVPDVDTTVTKRILEAGGHISGKAVCENLCHSATSHSSSTGIVEIPFAKGYSPGGSSSGSGVLVALGEVDGAIGADQGGSIRVPAANCGSFGLKPAFGLIPYTGCGSNEPTNDHIGPMTRTVLENALLLEAIAGTDSIDDRSFAAQSQSRIAVYTSIAKTSADQPLQGKNFAIIKESLSTPAMNLRIIQTFLTAVETYTFLGATATHISIPLHSKGAAIRTGVSKVGGYLSKTTGPFGRRGHRMLLLNSLFHYMSQENWDEAYASTKMMYLNGLYATKKFPNLLAKATNLSRQLLDAYDTALDQYDILLTSTLLHPVLALPIGILDVVEGPGVEAGVKLPVSMQIIGKWWNEMGVFEAAHAWERENTWRDM
ncbi:hypothetical protein PTT_19753 [Pyrenophora teres f. teres 0-1]|uniref:Amidase domain-containing protein n=1 Tax=Pyrenophora teres f. teres (strain 0-1) TaxID=861557 RepID=E3S9M0_PYRTT|nr:hypothetical protein PTT_19753 [Pyrenophora teres f. teres 0-1]